MLVMTMIGRVWTLMTKTVKEEINELIKIKKGILDWNVL